MVAILSAVLTDGLASVEAACAEALDQGVHSAAVILNILARKRDPGPAVTILTPDGAAAAPRADRRLRPLRPLAEGQLMERTEIFELMAALKLYGMRAAYDEVMAAGIKRQHEPPRIVGDLLKAEIAEKQARSIKYQLTIAKLPLAKDIDDFRFDGTPINEALVRELATGAFLAEQRNAVLIGGTGTGKSHLAIAIARACIRGGARGRFYTVVDLVNRLESEARAGRQGRLADYLTPPRLRRPRRIGLSALRPGRRPAAVPSDQPALRAHLDHRHHQPRFRRMAERLRRREDDDGAPRSPHPSLRDHRDRQRVLALQEPRLTQSRAPPGLPRWANRPPPARAAPSLVRALRVTRGSLLFATWTSPTPVEGGPFCMPIGGPVSVPIDRGDRLCLPSRIRVRPAVHLCRLQPQAVAWFPGLFLSVAVPGESRRRELRSELGGRHAGGAAVDAHASFRSAANRAVEPALP